MATEGTQPKRNVTRVAPAGPIEKPDRDPNKINDHIVIDFYSILGEPAQKGTRSIDCIWEFSEVMYDCFLNCCYNLFSFFCGCWIGIYWGIAFVPSIFASVWIFTPFASCLKIILGDWCRKCVLLYSNVCIRPCTKSFAYIFRHCGDGIIRRPPTPSLFPPRKDRPKKPDPKPKTPPAPKKEKEQEPVVVASHHRNTFDEYDKEKIARSVRRQMML